MRAALILLASSALAACGPDDPATPPEIPPPTPSDSVAASAVQTEAGAAPDKAEADTAAVTGPAAADGAEAEAEAGAEAEAEPEDQIPPSEPPSRLEPGMASAGSALTAEGWGPLRIGMSLEEVEDAVGEDSNPDAAGGPEPEVCDIFHPEDAPEGMMVMIQDGALSRITLSGESDVRTREGIGLGDPASAIENAYGDEAVTAPDAYLEPPARTYTVWTKGGDEDAPYIDDPAARGVRYLVDQSGTVTHIHAGDDSIQLVEGCL